MNKALCTQSKNRDYVVRQPAQIGLCENCEQVEECYQSRHHDDFPMVIPQPAPAGKIG